MKKMTVGLNECGSFDLRFGNVVMAQLMTLENAEHLADLYNAEQEFKDKQQEYDNLKKERSECFKLLYANTHLKSVDTIPGGTRLDSFMRSLINQAECLRSTERHDFQMIGGRLSICGKCGSSPDEQSPPPEQEKPEPEPKLKKELKELGSGCSCGNPIDHSYCNSCRKKWES